ncbi:MAG: DEAD/DEAH box helicase [Candidatus Cloacimonetes bacterium]|nr:DEAD/DEAH box helicase [Candidatus Cloacimonadota bacterium]
MRLKGSAPLLDFIAFDLETTGLDAMRDEIIEIAAVRFENGEVSKRFNCFVHPSGPVPAFIKQLTGITDAELAGGKPPATAMRELDEFLGESLVVGHNTPFDIGFHDEVRVRLNLAPRAFRTLDTLTLSRIFQPFIDNHKLETVAAACGVEILRAHRAIDDAEATGHVLLYLLAHMHDHVPLAVNVRLLELAALSSDKSELAWLLERVTDHQRRHALLVKQPTAREFAPANAIEHDVPSGKVYPLEAVFGDGGLFAGHFEGYEYRQGQVEMASAVEQALHTGECLLVEAGTGVGKSLAYLVPAIQFAERTQTRVVVSTNTKNLQEQLFHKDLPAIRDAVDVPFHAVLLKGRDNYVCPRKWSELTPQRGVSPWEAGGLLQLVVWVEQTRTGDISENSSFSRKQYASLWKRLAADRHFCMGKRCSHFKRCWLMDVRRRSEDAHIVIVNHSLLLTDVMGGNTTLGDYKRLVIDEAHNLSDAASHHLGITLSWTDINVFFGQLSSARSRWQGGTLPLFKAAVAKSGIPDDKKQTLQHATEAIEHLIEDGGFELKGLFVNAGSVCEREGSYGKLRLRDMATHAFLQPGLEAAAAMFAELERRLINLRESLATTSAQLFGEQDAHLNRLDGTVQRCGEFRVSLEPFLQPDFDDHAYWLSSFNAEQDAPNGMLHAAPLNIDEILNERLYDRLETLVCTSATLALRGVFKYFAHRVGLDRQENRRELVVPSPFDYTKQCRVLVAGFLPDPKDDFFRPQALAVLRDLIGQTRTGSLVLFTSHRDLQNAADFLAQPLYEQDIMLLAQRRGTGRTSLLNQFRRHDSSVLLGTSSFWEGVDVRGAALSMLALYKLPFQVPSEPIVEAHIERLKRQGLNPFQHYQLPTALLRFRQGVGRLIRSRSDRGVILILDRRVLTKSYGHYFNEISPTPWRATQDPIELLDIVTAFFRSL